jgi:hypothetical protein
MANPADQRSLLLLRTRWQRFLRNWRWKAEWPICPASEPRLIAGDVGSSERGLRGLHCSHPGPTELMPERLRQLGLDPAFIELDMPTTYRDLKRVCAACKSWRRCLRDLANNDVQAGMQGYCLNGPTIDALTVNRQISMHV